MLPLVKGVGFYAFEGELFEEVAGCVDCHMSGVLARGWYWDIYHAEDIMLARILFRNEQDSYI